MKKTSCLLLMLVLMVTVFAGCSGNDNKASMDVYVCIPGALDSHAQGVRAGIEEFDSQEVPLNVSYISMGINEMDTVGMMGSTAQWGGLVTAGEMDIMIADPDTARRFGDAGESYIWIKDMLTEEQIDKYSELLLSVEIVEEGELTGTYSESCGLKITDQAILDALGMEEAGVYIISNTAEKEKAIEIVLSMAGIE